MSPTLLVITGPTAIGKTGLAIQVAQELNTPILSADSRQFFREMSIGTAKPNAKELGSAIHYFIDNLSIQDDYDAGKYEKEAIGLLGNLFQKHSVVILCGGSGMYVDAVCKGFDPLPDVDEAHRQQLNELYRREGIGALQKLLLENDPEHYRNIDLNNPHRLIRALEITLGTGTPYSTLRKGTGAIREFSILKIGIRADRDLLYDRINKRVDRMMEDGLQEEVRNLYNFRHLNALQTVGYKELFEQIEGRITLTEATEQIKQNTRRFAKRQMTWFRKDKSINWIDLQEELKMKELILEKLKIHS